MLWRHLKADTSLQTYSMNTRDIKLSYNLVTFWEGVGTTVLNE